MLTRVKILISVQSQSQLVVRFMSIFSFASHKMAVNVGKTNNNEIYNKFSVIRMEVFMMESAWKS